MAGTLGRKAAILSLITLQMLLWQTLPELSKTREALEIAVPNLSQTKRQEGRRERQGVPLKAFRTTVKARALLFTGVFFFAQGYALGVDKMYRIRYVFKIRRRDSLDVYHTRSQRVKTSTKHTISNWG